jgi:hypothetical protein
MHFNKTSKSLAYLALILQEVTGLESASCTCESSEAGGACESGSTRKASGPRVSSEACIQFDACSEMIHESSADVRILCYA